MKKRRISYLIILVILFSISFTNAFEFNGTVYDINGNLLNNSVINVTIRNTNGFSVVGYNFTTTNASGWFNMTVPNNNQWLYEPLITYKNTSGTLSYVAYVGQSLPAFPSFVYDQLGSISFYLREAGTINITAINSTGQRIAFNYQVKDSALGYPIAENFAASGGVIEVNIVVPRDRNYSIAAFPNQSLPAFFNWNNFTSTNSYNIVTTTSGNISKYNVTTRTLHKQFNITISLPQITGFINASNVTSTSGWDAFSVVPFMLEPGNMVHATFGTLPSNLSTFIGTGLTDLFNLTSGFYNITLPASVETANYLLFATARNGSGYYGGIANISLSYGSAGVRINFSMYGLMGIGSNFSLDNANNFAQKKNVGVAKQRFQLVNVTNGSLTQSSVHIETTVDYSSYGAIEFTWVEEVGQESNGNFSIPLLNITGVKEMNVFVGGGNYAPKRIAPTIAQLTTDNNANANVSNISISSFNPGAIDSTLSASSITMGLYISNSTCDVPDPPSSCLIGGSESDMSSFNPMSSIIGGGKLSFRMGTAGILVHYVNVDMMASGPPDALFDDKTRNGTSGSGFSAAIRFGSGGPTVYDYVLVSIPYSESTSTGLNDTQPVNISIPYYYDENWNVIWNVTTNSTNITSFANNFTHYSAKQSDWQYLLNSITCATNSSLFNITNPCYINATSNQIWIRLPHFSGTGPSITGNAITAASSSSGSSSSSGGGSGGITSGSNWTTSFAYDKEEFSNVGSINKQLVEKQRVKILVNNESHYVGVLEVTATNAKIEIASNPQQVIINKGEEKKVDVTSDGYYDLLVKLNNIVGKKTDLTISYINEKIESVKEEAPAAPASQPAATPQSAPENKINIGNWIWLIIALIFIIALWAIYYVRKKKR